MITISATIFLPLASLSLLNYPPASDTHLESETAEP